MISLRLFASSALLYGRLIAVSMAVHAILDAHKLELYGGAYLSDCANRALSVRLAQRGTVQW